LKTPEQLSNPHDKRVEADLLKTLSEHSGLPIDVLQDEIQSILDMTGSETEGLSLEQLRFVLLKYLNHLDQAESANTSDA